MKPPFNKNKIIFFLNIRKRFGITDTPIKINENLIYEKGYFHHIQPKTLKK